MAIEAPPFFDPRNELTPQVREVMADLLTVNRGLNEDYEHGRVDRTQLQLRKDVLAARLLRFFINGYTLDKVTVGIYKYLDEEILPFSSNNIRLTYTHNPRDNPFRTTTSLRSLVGTNAFKDSVEIADALDGRYETLAESPYDSLRRTHHELQITKSKMQDVSIEQMIDLRLIEGKLARRLLAHYIDPDTNGQLPQMLIYLIKGKQKALGFIFPDTQLGSVIVNDIESLPDKIGTLLKQDVKAIGGYTQTTSRAQFMEIAFSSSQNPPQTTS